MRNRAGIWCLLKTLLSLILMVAGNFGVIAVIIIDLEKFAPGLPKRCLLDPVATDLCLSPLFFWKTICF